MPRRWGFQLTPPHAPRSERANHEEAKGPSTNPTPAPAPCRYLLISVTSGCEPANRVWYVDLAAIPTTPHTGALDFGACDFHKGAQPLPLVKLVDDFRVRWKGGG